MKVDHMMRACLLVLLLGASPALASPQASPPTAVAANGTTTIAAMLSDTKVVATIRAATTPSHSVHVCSGGRTVCSPVEKLELTVGSAKVWVPDSVVASLTDVNSASLSSNGWTQYVLNLDCSDAAAATRVRLLFDRNRVIEREVVAGEAGMVAERTYYEDLSGAFN